MPKHFMSKRDHLHDKAKWQLHVIGKRMLGGEVVHPDEHAGAVALHREGDSTEHRFLCDLCGETFVPLGWPNNKHIVIGAHAVILPGGRFLHPELTPDGNQREIPICICPECCSKTVIAKHVELDWDLHDHLAQPNSK